MLITPYIYLLTNELLLVLTITSAKECFWNKRTIENLGHILLSKHWKA